MRDLAPFLVGVPKVHLRRIGVEKVFIENDVWGAFLLAHTRCERAEGESIWMRLGVTWSPEDGVQSALVTDNRRVIWEGRAT